MSVVISPNIWYPYGYPGSAYNLEKVYAWADGPEAGQVSVRFRELGTSFVVVFNLTAFEAAMSGGAPVLLTAPVVSGTGYVGYTLTSTGGLWTSTPYPTITYQWQRNTGVWADIVGEVTSSYTVPLVDEGVPLRCVITATNPYGVVVANSNVIEQWVPSDGGTLEYWFDAFNPTSITLVGSAVTAWADVSGKGRTVSQSNASRQPVYDVVGYDGYPTIIFNGTTTGLRRGSFDITGLGNNIPAFSHYFVYGITDILSGNRQIAGFTYGGNNIIPRLECAYNGTLANEGWKARGRRLDTDPEDNVYGILPLEAGAHLGSHYYDFSVARVWAGSDGVEGAHYAFGTAGNTSPTDARALSIGIFTNPVVDFHYGPISEIFAYAFVPSYPVQEKILAYQAWRWRKTELLPLSSPYTSEAPTP